MANSFTSEERKVLYNDIITYSEFIESTTGQLLDADTKKEMDEDTTSSQYVDKQAPWFHKYQKRAMSMLRRGVPQVHLLPRNREDYMDLKTDFYIDELTNTAHTEPMNYQEMFRDALSQQILFLKENEITMDNGWLNATTNFSVGSYAQGGQNPLMFRKVFNEICPNARDYLEQMGWMGGCLNHPLQWEIFYKGEH